jgi:hypothetical protein
VLLQRRKSAAAELADAASADKAIALSNSALNINLE